MLLKDFFFIMTEVLALAAGVACTNITSHPSKVTTVTSVNVFRSLRFFQLDGKFSMFRDSHEFCCGIRTGTVSQIVSLRLCMVGNEVIKDLLDTSERF